MTVKGDLRILDLSFRQGSNTGIPFFSNYQKKNNFYKIYKGKNVT